MCDGCGGLVRVVEAFYTMLLHVSQKRQNPLHLGLDHVTSGWLVNVEIEPKSTFAAPQAASPWARAAPSRARQPYPPPPALGSRPSSSAGSSCWAARQQELDLRHTCTEIRVVTAPLWLPSFGARDGNGPRHPLHRVGVLGSGGRHSPATSVGCPSLATVGVPSSRTQGAANNEDFINSVCISIGTLSDMPRVRLLKRSRWLWPAGRRRPPVSRSDGMPGIQPFVTILTEPLTQRAA